MQFKRRGVSGRRQRQRGFTLLDASLALLVGSSLAAASVVYKMDERGDDRARAQGLAMITLQGAVNQYLTDHFGELVKTGGGTVPGVAVPRAPTVTELRAVGALKDPFATQAFNGGNYRVQISTFPAGCVAPACNLDGLIWIDRPIVDWRNNIDYPRLGVAVRTIGSDGAMSNSAAPGTLLGMQGKWSTANPAGAAAGLLAARTGYNSAAYAQFYRRDGSLAMTNDIAAGGYNLNNVNAVNSNTVNSNKVNLPAGNSLQVGNAAVYGDATNAAVRSPSGNVYIQDLNGNVGTAVARDGIFAGNVSVSGTSTTYGNSNVSGNAWLGGSQSISGHLSVAGTTSTNQMNASWVNVWGDQTVYGNHYVNGAMVARNMVYLPALAWAGWGCGGNGVTTDPNGSLLSCKGGVWVATGGDPPAGSLCGVQWNTGAPTVPCMGIGWGGGPMACPAGWNRTEVLVEGGNRMNMCVKA